MGILNVTPDSFYDGGRYTDYDSAIRRAHDIADEGADFLDIGGESSRPGAAPVHAQEEIDRVCPVIEYISRNINIEISVDTTKSAVADAALRAGASIINDISGLCHDESMASVIAAFNAGAVIMHMRGTPQTMQHDTVYGNVVKEVYEFLRDSVERAVEKGIQREKIILDPGIGFGKSVEDNYTLVKNAAYFKSLGLPLLIGVSRKSMIGRLFEGDFDRLPATIALHAAAALNGADIVRVHDVKAHRLALAAIEMLQRAPGAHGNSF